jgi:hypothetical protein
LSQCFRKLFKRGTVQDWQKLLPKTYTLQEGSVEDKQYLHAKAAVKCIEALVEAHSQDLLDSHNPTTDAVTTSTFQRIDNLIQHIGKLEKSQQINTFEIRLNYLLFTHELECIDSTASSDGRAPGLRRRVNTLRKIEKTCNVEPEKLKEICKRSAKYLKIAQIGGLGCLAIIGTKTT